MSAPASPRSPRRPRAAAKRFRLLRFTRDGKYFVALSLGIGFAAINTGNNLLYLVLGMMLTMIIGSGILSELAIWGLHVERDTPPRVYAGRPTLIGVQLRNTKRRLPSFSVEVQDMMDGRALDKRCYFLKLPAGRTQHASYRHTFSNRGRHQLTHLALATQFPFGLFRKSRRVARRLELIVYPAMQPVMPPEGRRPGAGERHAERLGRRGEFHTLREFREGDDPHDIYWRKSARTGRPVVRQNEEPTGRRVAIFVDNHQRVEVLSPEQIDQREDAVSRAASLAAHYIGRGYAVGLVTRTVSVPTAAGQAQLDRLLRALALLEFTREQRPFAQPARWAGDSVFIAAGAGGATVQASFDGHRAA